MSETEGWTVKGLKGFEEEVRISRGAQIVREGELSRAKLDCMLHTSLNVRVPDDLRFVEEFLLEFIDPDSFNSREIKDRELTQVVEKLMSVYRLSKADSARQYWYVFIARDGVGYQVELMLAIDGSSSAITVKKQPQKHVKEDDK